MSGIDDQLKEFDRAAEKFMEAANEPISRREIMDLLMKLRECIGNIRAFLDEQSY